ncbi:putative MLO-like protein 15 [Cocos nucifera]|nr:putative MLO-like protein 15 [Cocos nucifera]
MGSSFKKAIFDENVREGLVGWAHQVRKRKGKRMVNRESGSTSAPQSSNGTSVGIPLQNLLVPKDSVMEEGKAEIAEDKALLKNAT